MTTSSRVVQLRANRPTAAVPVGGTAGGPPAHRAPAPPLHTRLPTQGTEQHGYASLPLVSRRPTTLLDVDVEPNTEEVS